MTKVISLIFLLSFMVACDQPAARRSKSVTDYTPLAQESKDGNDGNFQTTGDDSTVDQFGDDYQTGAGAGYESCNFNYTQSSGQIVNVSVCQNESVETKIKVKFGDQDYTDGTCFIPAHTLSSNQSFYVGIAQCTYHHTDQVIEGTLVKNRPGFSNYNINTVMVMKKSSVNAYFTCMDAVSVYLNSVNQSCSWVNNANCHGYYGSQYYSCLNCMSQANAYMKTKCDEFKYNHNYIEWNF